MATFMLARRSRQKVESPPLRQIELPNPANKARRDELPRQPGATKMASPFKRLPTELIQMIAEETSSRDLLALRQTCTTLEGAVFRPFCKKHLNHLAGFMFDSKHLSCMQPILDKPQLAEHVRKICFTQQCASVALRRVAPEKGASQVKAKKDSSRPAQLHAIEVFFKRVANLQVKRRSEGLPALFLNLDFSFDDDVLEHMKSNGYAGLPEYPLRIAAEHGCILSALRLDNRHKIEPYRFSFNGDLRSMVVNLEHLRIDFEPQWHDSTQWTLDQELVRNVTAVTKLKLLALMLRGNKMTGWQFTDQYAQLLRHTDLSQIRDLRLGGTTMSLHALLTILHRCRDTLENFTLRYTSIREPGDPVFQLLQHLKIFPKLQDFDFCRIEKDGRPLERDQLEAYFVVEQEGKPCWTPYPQKQSAKSFLEWNIKQGGLQHAQPGRFRPPVLTWTTCMQDVRSGVVWVWRSIPHWER